MSIIVVEGVDGSGKSTLLENARLQIPKKYFVLVRHSCRPLSTEQILDFLNFIEEGRLPIILDRHPLISEPIYGPVLRKENLVDGIENESSAIDRLVATVDRIIYCRPPDPVIEKNLCNLPQLAGIHENIWDLLDAYDQRMHQLHKRGMDVIQYDYTTPSYSMENLFFGNLIT